MQVKGDQTWRWTVMQCRGYYGMAYLVRCWINDLMSVGQARVRASLLARCYLSRINAANVQHLQLHASSRIAPGNVLIEARGVSCNELV